MSALPRSCLRQTALADGGLAGGRRSEQLTLAIPFLPSSLYSIAHQTDGPRGAHAADADACAHWKEKEEKGKNEWKKKKRGRGRGRNKKLQ